VQVINGLKILFAPILPFTAQTLHEMLGETGQLFGRPKVETYQESSKSHVALTYDGRDAIGNWQLTEIPPGRELPPPTPLFKKLEPTIADEEIARLGRPQ
jgi:methionyl-tRNA synthetase